MTSSSSGDDPSKEEPISLSLHDSLALGEIEAGLLAQKQNRSEIDEIQRLPVLLRLLSSSRPLSSIPTFDTATEESESEVAANSTPIDELANEVVARLEDVAATYSVAEGVDVVACHLAPTICRNLSKLPPLKKRKRDCQWETNDLVVIGATPRSRQNKKRRRDSDTQSLTRTDSADELNLETDDLSAEEAGGAGGMSSDDDDKIAGSLHGGYSSSNRRYSRRASADAGITGSEDSQEEVVSKTLSDLSALVVASLEPIRADSNDKAGEEGTTAFLRKGNLALAMDDSALSEPSRGQMTTTTAESVGDVMTGSDLGATVAALMHHAPVLRHRHVAVSII